MQQKIQQFVFISERLLSESGELRSRRSWKELSNISSQLEPQMVQLTQSFDPKYALLFLLSCNNTENNSNQKNGLFSILLRKILSRIPNDDILNLLSSISRVDLNTFLLPFLYEKGDIGSVATYVSAKLGLKIQTDSFEFFLTSREWTQEDLVNLSFLVLSDEKDSLIMNLDTTFNENPKEVFGQFLNVLNASNIKEPIIPTIQSIERIEDDNKVTTTHTQTKKQIPTPKSILQKLPSNQNYKYKIPGLNKQSSSVTNQINNQNDEKNDSSLFNKQSVNTDTTINNPNKSSPQNTIYSQVNNPPTPSDNITNNEQQNKTSAYSVLAKYTTQDSEQKSEQEIHQKNEDNKPVNSNIETKSEANKNISDSIKEKLSGFDFSSTLEKLKDPIYIISFVIIIVGFIYLLISFNSTSKSDKIELVKAPPKTIKIPEYWIDAITNKKITPRYMQADVDYRMGELYLSRNMFVEAISFFQSALKTEPNHHVAKLRWGYSEFMQGHYVEADKLLNEVYKVDSKLQNLNLYLARNNYFLKKYEKADKFYNEEYKLSNSLSVGMEYANFLAKSGDMDKAMSFLAFLQSKNPGKTLVLDSKSINSNNNQKQNNKK